MIFEVFHKRGNVIKTILSYIHTLLEGNVAALEVFLYVLLRMKYWGGYEVTSWLLNKPNSRLKGRHTKEFTQKIPKVIRQIKKLLIDGEVNHLCRALALYAKMNIFVGYTIIDNWVTANHCL